MTKHININQKMQNRPKAKKNVTISTPSNLEPLKKNKISNIIKEKDKTSNIRLKKIPTVPKETKIDEYPNKKEKKNPIQTILGKKKFITLGNDKIDINQIKLPGIVTVKIAQEEEEEPSIIHFKTKYSHNAKHINKKITK